jgi:hypothetical protein
MVFVIIHLLIEFNHVSIINRSLCELITEFVTRVTRRASLVEQEMCTLPEHLSSPAVFSGVRITRSLVLCVMFCRSPFVLFLFLLYIFDIIQIKKSLKILKG